MLDLEPRQGSPPRLRETTGDHSGLLVVHSRLLGPIRLCWGAQAPLCRPVGNIGMQDCLFRLQGSLQPRGGGLLDGIAEEPRVRL